MITKPVSESTGQELPESEQQKPASNQEEHNAAPAVPAESGQDDAAIPDKFRGKSIEEISKSYKELESYAGRISSEKTHSDRAADEMKTRLAALEQHVQTLAYQRPHQTQTTPEADPFASIDQEFEADPRAAFKKLVEYTRSKPAEIETRLALENRARAANDYYNRQMKENPDFQKLEPDMKRLASRYASIVRPDLVNSPETMELLYKLAKSENLESYNKEAAEKAIKANNLVRTEKRQAVSESSSTSGTASSGKPFEEWSLDEMERFLGRAAK